MRTVERIKRQIKIYTILYKVSKRLNYRPSMYWYLAKLETLLWVLGDDYARIKICKLEGIEERINMSKTPLS